MGYYDRIFDNIAALAAGESVQGWTIIYELRGEPDFPYNQLSDDEIVALRNLCDDLWFYADMSDDYQVTLKEQREIGPVRSEVKAELANRGIR